MTDLAESVLEVRDVVKHFTVGGPSAWSTRTVRAVDGVSLDVGSRATVAVVGESGSGKSTLGRCVVRLTEPTAGSIRFRGTEVTTLSGRELRSLRRHVQMVFQDFEASLNPRHTVRRALGEPLRRLRGCRGRAAEAEIRALVQDVEMRADDLAKYPHQLSGGQQQRISIARALAPRPRLVVLDEPLSSLDVSVRVQIADLFLSLQERYGLSYLLISHDLSMVKYIAHTVAVMYLGQLVETGPVGAVFRDPWHPYTQALLGSVLAPDPDVAPRAPLLEGEVPSPVDPPPGCRFHTRCPRAVDRCRQAPVALRPLGDARAVACIRVGE